jgi:hypothetical protein
VAVKTIWPITYACGHSEDRDLCSKRVDERAGYARWLASKDCTDCWRATQADTGERVTKEQWLERKRAEEAEEVGAWEQRAGMFALNGSEKAAAWGRRVRHSILTSAYDALVVESDMSDEQWIAHIEASARLITCASWWIDNRDADPADVAELVAAAQPTSAAACENDA